LTSGQDPRIPILMPIAFPDLNWQKRSHIRLLMSSTNAIVAKTESVDSVWTSLKDALENIGLHPSIIDDKGNINFDKKIPKDIILGFNTEQCVQFAEHNKLTELKKNN